MTIDHLPGIHDSQFGMDHDRKLILPRASARRRVQLGQKSIQKSMKDLEYNAEHATWPLEAMHFLAEIGERDLIEAVAPLDAEPVADALLALRGEMKTSRPETDPRMRVLGWLKGRSESGILDEEGDAYTTPKSLRRWFTDFASAISSSYEHADIVQYVTSSVAASHSDDGVPLPPERLANSPLAGKPADNIYQGVVVPVLQRRQYEQSREAADLSVDMFNLAKDRRVVPVEQWMDARKLVIGTAITRRIITPPQGTAMVRRLELTPHSQDCSEELINEALDPLRDRLHKMKREARLRREAGPILQATRMFLTPQERVPSIDEMVPRLHTDYPNAEVTRYWVARKVYGGMAEVMGLNKPQSKL